MNRLGAHAGSYHGHPLEQALEGIAAAGFKYVELTSIRGVLEQVPVEATEQELRETECLLRRAGLEVIALSGHSDLTTKNGVADARRALRNCERLGAGILTTAVGGAFNEDENEQAFLAHIHALAGEAEKKQVKIALEVHGTLTGTGALARRLVEDVGDPSVVVAYDTANCEYYAGVSAEIDLPATLPYVGHCHLKDTVGGRRNWNFPPLGQGCVNFEQVLTIMRKAGYVGPYSVEIEFQGGSMQPLSVVNRAMASSKKYLKSLGVS